MEEVKEDKQKLFERLWNNEDGLNEDQFNEMMAEWAKENIQEEYNEQFANEWGKQWQQEVPAEVTNVIPFQAANKYMDHASDRVVLAKNLVEEG